jgi:hypothetical protein
MPHPGHYTQGKDTVSIVQEAGWVPGSVWTGAETLASSGVQFLHHPSCSKLLCQLHYIGPQFKCHGLLFYT